MRAVKDPTPYLPWLISRASGIVALALVTTAVLLGLVMSARLLRRPGLGRVLVRLHEHVALVAMGAIAVHGLALLGDHWLHPGLRGLIVPFAMSYRPLFTGMGIIGGYLAALLGLSFYARRRIGVKLWRRLHRATVLVWLLAVVHTLGSGSDAATVWLRGLALAPAVPITYLVVRRVLGRRRREIVRSRAERAGHARTTAAPPPVLRARALAEESR
jgi:sulfoxide reductase heme-binding subunit YedZ